MPTLENVAVDPSRKLYFPPACQPLRAVVIMYLQTDALPRIALIPKLPELPKFPTLPSLLIELKRSFWKISDDSD
jgi:hypothetical protein